MSKKLPIKPSKRKRIEPRQPKLPKEPPMKPIKGCACGHPERIGTHTAVGCY